MANKPVVVEIPFPVGGIDQSSRREAQPPLTCPDALNVVSFPSISDRRGGGKCDGMRQSLTDQLIDLGDGFPVRITCLSILPDSEFTPPVDPPEDHDPDTGDPHEPPDDDPDDLPNLPGNPNTPDGVSDDDVIQTVSFGDDDDTLDVWLQIDEYLALSADASPPGPLFGGDDPTEVYNAAGQPYLVIATSVGVGYVCNIAADTSTLYAPVQFTQFFPQVTPYGKALPVIEGGTGEYGTTGPYWFGVDGDMNLRVDPASVLGVCPSSDWATLVDAYRAALFLDPAPLPLGCRLVCVYRGRIVLARQDGVNADLLAADRNASMWYMSRVLNPYDWGYTEDPIETCAVAGTDPTLGQPADAIVALIPSGDDYLVFGCASSMYMMEGDPGYGGRVQILSRDTGIVGTRAWCFDESGVLYFMGTGGLYRFRGPGTPVENVSGARVFRFLSRISLTETLVQLVYDAMKRRVHIYLTSVNTSVQNDHFVYDVAGNSFWKRKFEVLPRGLYLEDNIEPWSVCAFNGPADQDRRFLIGNQYGRLYRPLDTALGDNELRYKGPGTFTGQGTGDPITSFFRSAPLVPYGHFIESMAVELQADLPDNNPPLSLPTDAVSWYWLCAQSESEIANKGFVDARATGEWGADNGYGFQDPASLRHAGAVHQIIVRQESADATWGIERIAATFRPAGRRRRRES